MTQEPQQNLLGQDIQQPGCASVGGSQHGIDCRPGSWSCPTCGEHYAARCRCNGPITQPPFPPGFAHRGEPLETGPLVAALCNLLDALRASERREGYAAGFAAGRESVL
jgi:hypothetical protein